MNDYLILIFNGFCLAIAVVMFIGTILPEEKVDKKTFRFMFLLISLSLYIISTFISEYFEGKPEYNDLLTFANVLCFIIVDVVIAAFTRYYQSIIKSSHYKKQTPFYVTLILCAVRSTLSLVLYFTGNLFAMVDGEYVSADAAAISYYFVGIIVFSLLFGIISTRKNYTKREITVAIVYLLLPIPSVVIELYTETAVLTEMTLTLSLLMMFVLIQGVAIQRSKMRESVLQEISHTDLLTDIGNRRAYYESMAALTADQDVGVLFCDINGLKYINDHYGHSIGDEYIKKFAKYFGEAFRYDDIFRISGDEFTAIIPDISSEVFFARVKEFIDVIKASGNMAAIGSAYGKGADVEKLISQAESEMYEIKQKTGGSRDSVTTNQIS